MSAVHGAPYHPEAKLLLVLLVPAQRLLLAAVCSAPPSNLILSSPGESSLTAVRIMALSVSYQGFFLM